MNIYCEGSACSKRDICALHCNIIENEVYEYIDFSQYASGSCNGDGLATIEHWCGDTGNFKRFKSIT